MAAWGQPAFRARQLAKWLYKGVGAFEDMTDLARPFRAELAKRARISGLEIAQVQGAADGCPEIPVRPGRRQPDRIGAHPGRGPLYPVSVHPGRVCPGVPFLSDGPAGPDPQPGGQRNRQSSHGGAPGTDGWTAPHQPGLYGHGGAPGQFSGPGAGPHRDQRPLGVELLFPAAHRLHRGVGPAHPPVWALRPGPT